MRHDSRPRPVTISAPGGGAISRQGSGLVFQQGPTDFTCGIVGAELSAGKYEVHLAAPTASASTLEELGGPRKVIAYTLNGHRVAVGAEVWLRRRGMSPDGVVWDMIPTTASRPSKVVTDACLVTDSYGAVVGIALFEEHSDGRGRCVVRGPCADCGSSDVPDPPPESCVTVSGTVTFQPEATAAGLAGMSLAGYGLFSAAADGTYSVDVSFHSATLGFTCGCPVGEVNPRDVYYSLDGGASWTLAGTSCAGGFSLELPTSCTGKTVLWELWEPGLTPEVVTNPGDIVIDP